MTPSRLALRWPPWLDSSVGFYPPDPSWRCLTWSAARRRSSTAGCATCSMKPISSSADFTLPRVRLPARSCRDRAPTKRSAMSKTWWMLWPMKMDRAAACAHLPHELEDLGRLGQRQGRGRLVENDEVRLLVDGARRSPRPGARRRKAARRSSCGVNAFEVKPISRISRLRLADLAASTFSQPKRPASSRPMKMLRTIDC